MIFRILGPVTIETGDGVRPAGAVKQRTMLVALVADAGRLVTMETLIDRVWGESPPSSVRSSLYAYVTRLRAQLAGIENVSLVRNPGGYTLLVPPGQIDAGHARALAERAARAGDEERAALLDEALGLWRGVALTGVAGDWAERYRQNLEQQRIALAADWAESALRLGRSGEVIGVLTPLLVEHPLAERLIGQHMRALHHSGRHAEALTAYAAASERIRDKLGVDPSPWLREVHAGLLRRDPAPRSGSPTGRLSQLPPDITDFTGASAGLARVLATVEGAGRPGTALPIVFISGRSGVGKSTLAVRAAHLLQERYPDGQLHIALRGAQARPVTPAEALDRLLRLLRVEGHDESLPLEDKIELYRLALASRRVLVVLDDAADTAQIRPLLPGSGTCAVLVTSRRRPDGLPGATVVELTEMAEAESLDLLRAIVGAGRVAAEPDAARALVALCDRLPLAIRVVGARLQRKPHWSLAHLAHRLDDERRRLDELSIGDLGVRAGISASCAEVGAPALRAFCLLGHLDPPDFDLMVTASLLNLGPEATEEIVEELIDARLVEPLPAGDGLIRYRMHDLVRLYAKERAAGTMPAPELAAAVHRALEKMLALCEGLTQQLPIALPRLGGSAPALPADDAGQWFATAESALIVAVERAAELGLDTLACALADTLIFTSFGGSNRFAGWNRTHTAALAAARAKGNRRAEAVIECGLGQLAYNGDDFDEAERRFRVALQLFRAEGDERGAAVALNGLGTVHREVGEHHTALPLMEQALAALSALGDEEGIAHARYGIGFSNRELGHDDQAVGNLRDALARYRDLGHRRGEALALRGIGLVHRARGELADAEDLCGRAHRIILATGDEVLVNYTSQALAKVWIRQNRLAEAEPPLRAVVAATARFHDRVGTGLGLRTLGELSLAAHRPREALSWLGRALDTWDELRLPLWRARTLRDVGAAHALLGERPRAERAWREAADVFGRFLTRDAAELPAWRARWTSD
ncbi:AfsR/SARP family transcriptional regulator [Nonomuraea sp. SBT364]|uniref:AfsR/SARP family transcriptional regulator n=1 Tax=Nonomuraea sp. SBT364 TaxID=1580530 RepID=UPI00066E57C7|nr:BTAD domain-containing putative transcriptional regulator [Nonomuraea sp. SBT364]